MAADRLVGTARAKVNLWLHVLGRRADGYHLLDSLVAFPAIGDVIEVEPSRFLSLTVDGPFAAELGGGADNLVIAAADALSRALQRPNAPAPGAAIRLVKRLPLASGLGGGSSDAATTLLLLMRLWRAQIDAATLQRLALSLGADVPACLAAPSPVFLRGVGDVVAPAPSPPSGTLLLVNPGAPVATPRVFAALSTPQNAPPPAFAQAEDLAAFVARLGRTRNDLEAPAIGIAPVIADVLERLRAAPGCLFARMSGSGATCFGLFPSEHPARAAEEVIRRTEPRWWTGVGALA